MKAEQTVKVTSCDGCDYGMGRYKAISELAREPDGRVIVLLYPHPDNVGFEEFHFHEGPSRDCLRYWLMSERVMRRSLEAREWHSAAIDEFVARVCGAPAKKAA